MKHSSLWEGTRLGLVVATTIWLWLAGIDAVVGQPFRTFAVLGGIAQFTLLHYGLNVAYGIAIVRAYTSSSWWHAEMWKAEMILFPAGKTKFVRPDGSIGKCPGHGIVLVGAGAVACKALIASGLGMVWDRRSKLKRRAA